MITNGMETYRRTEDYCSQYVLNFTIQSTDLFLYLKVTTRIGESESKIILKVLLVSK